MPSVTVVNLLFNIQRQEVNSCFFGLFCFAPSQTWNGEVVNSPEYGNRCYSKEDTYCTKMIHLMLNLGAHLNVKPNFILEKEKRNLKALSHSWYWLKPLKRDSRGDTVLTQYSLYDCHPCTKFCLNYHSDMHSGHKQIHFCSALSSQGNFHFDWRKHT